MVFDFGTTYFKAALVDRHGRLVAFARVPTPIVRTGDRSEIDPQTFFQTIRTACTALASQRIEALADVRAITFCTQANSFVLLDEHEKPLAPLIIWNDDRARPFAADFERWNDDPTFFARTGIPAMSHGFTPARLRWLAGNAPEVIARTRHLCFLGDYFTFWLTGMLVTDYSVAGISGLFDAEAGEWSAEWAGRVYADVGWLPQVVRSGTTIASILPAVAAETGLPRDCIVVVGVLDQYAGAMGVGNNEVGGLSETTGTVLATVRCADQFMPPDETRAYAGSGAHAGQYYHMMFGDVSAALLEVYRDELPDRPSVQQLDETLPQQPDRTLELDHTANIETLRSTLQTWAKTKPRDAVVACIYRTVARALRDQVRLLTGGAPAPLIRSAGGASRSRKWLQIKADELGCPVLAPAIHEPTLVGAAQLAAGALKWPRLPSEDRAVPKHLLIHPSR